MVPPSEAEAVSIPPVAPLDFERLVAAVLPLDHYHRELEPLLADLVRIVVLNDQLNGAFRRIAERAGFTHGGEIARAHLGDDAAAVHTFFEYVYFASPAFLSTVGEWPLGGVRG